MKCNKLIKIFFLWLLLLISNRNTVITNELISFIFTLNITSLSVSIFYIQTIMSSNIVVKNNPISHEEEAFYSYNSELHKLKKVEHVVKTYEAIIEIIISMVFISFSYIKYEKLFVMLSFALTALVVFELIGMLNYVINDVKRHIKNIE